MSRGGWNVCRSSSCLRLFQCELSTILYPVFVQMYLELVYNGHSADGNTGGSIAMVFRYSERPTLPGLVEEESVGVSEILLKFASNFYGIPLLKSHPTGTACYLNGDIAHHESSR